MQSPRHRTGTAADYLSLLYASTGSTPVPAAVADGPPPTISFPAGQLEQLWSSRGGAEESEDEPGGGAGEEEEEEGAEDDEGQDGSGARSPSPCAVTATAPGADRDGEPESRAPIVTPAAGSLLISQVAAEEAIAADLRRLGLGRAMAARGRGPSDFVAAASDCPQSLASDGPSPAESLDLQPAPLSPPLTPSSQVPLVRLSSLPSGEPPEAGTRWGAVTPAPGLGGSAATDAGLSPAAPNVLWRRLAPPAHLPPHLATALATRDAALAAAAELKACAAAVGVAPASTLEPLSPAAAAAATAAAMSPYVTRRRDVTTARGLTAIAVESPRWRPGALADSRAGGSLRSPASPVAFQRLAGGLPPATREALIASEIPRSAPGAGGCVLGPAGAADSVSAGSGSALASLMVDAAAAAFVGQPAAVFARRGAGAARVAVRGRG